MIERIDTETDEAIYNIKEGRKELVNYYEYIKSNRKFIFMVRLSI